MRNMHYRRNMYYAKYILQTEQKLKIVKECCEGYKMPMIYNDTETDARCSPLCDKCLAGVCIAPNKCQCDPGYHGDDCAHGELILKLID